MDVFNDDFHLVKRINLHDTQQHFSPLLLWRIEDNHLFIRVNFHTHTLILCFYFYHIFSHLLPSFASISHISNFIVVVLLAYIYRVREREREMGMNKNVFIFQWEIFALPFSQQSLNAFVAKIHFFSLLAACSHPKFSFLSYFFFSFSPTPPLLNLCTFCRFRKHRGARGTWNEKFIFSLPSCEAKRHLMMNMNE